MSEAGWEGNLWICDCGQKYEVSMHGGGGESVRVRESEDLRSNSGPGFDRIVDVLGIRIDAARSSSKNAMPQVGYDPDIWTCVASRTAEGVVESGDAGFQKHRLKWRPDVVFQKSRCECGAWYEFRPDYWRAVGWMSAILSLALVVLVIFFYEVGL